MRASFTTSLLLLLLSAAGKKVLAADDDDSTRRIWVKFRRENERTLPGIIADKIANMNPLIPTRKGRSKKLLKQWFQLTLSEAANTEAILTGLQALPGILAAEVAPPAVEPPSRVFSNLQGYLEDTDIKTVWEFYENTGNGVTVFDIEFDWNLVHEDLNVAADYIVSDGDEIDPLFDPNHGTAVLGELVGDGHNHLGILGTVYDANVKLVPVNTKKLGYNPAAAIILATEHAKPGDVILLELQNPACGFDEFGPVEALLPAFDAISIAVSRGITVVEAAGNGGVDLDSNACGRSFDINYQDSGAIIVGASDEDTRKRASFSTYGSRVDVHGWGTRVMTTGYGNFFDADSPTDTSKWYTPSFGGTSSASAMIAGAAALLQSVSIQERGEPLSPIDVRTLLRETGSPQDADDSKHMGPLPNVLNAVEAMLCQPICEVPDFVTSASVTVDPLPIAALVPRLGLKMHDAWSRPLTVGGGGLLASGGTEALAVHQHLVIPWQQPEVTTV
eukprot:CAMPEP_0118691142 /NCGR_PEP_ID=MMETSP0800-20121206/10513_1 /TAXON_ID=210618 ORGANISM="Striatella unipunctata, Strain CCMP2910" /NCGR_SAMPLE_ID=MMETSP0800 /ASSEMBLY_ACC=CAM_ASM_000638 /LENGTH=503 /DNA_ID=CAMNT_0006588883 /DNA_START=74 /DNA_END=1586 /DNA_ORIENTATION=-